MPAVEDLTPVTVKSTVSPPAETTILGAIAGCIAHEFNNFLTRILLHIEAARTSGFLPKESAVFLDRAEEEILQAKHTTDELLSLSGNSRPYERIPIHVLFPSDISAPRLGSGHENQTGREGGWIVEGDREQLEIAFRNLARYVSSVVPSAAISAYIEIFYPKETAPGDFTAARYARIALTPDHSVAQNAGEVLLDPFRPGLKDGTGLGLIIGYSVIQRHGGAVRLLHNACVTAGLAVYLPLSAEGADPEGEETPAARSRGKILLMDDEESIRSITEILFFRLGYEITTVRDGAEAVKAFAEARESGSPYDVVILDLTIPGGMGGKEAIRRLREIDTGVKAIVSSGYLGGRGAEDYRALGFNDSVEKPYRLETLAAAVEKLLKSGR